MNLEPVIGLEIHVQLATESKMFCACKNPVELLPPNTSICPVCMGHPGTLPVPNRHAIELGIVVGKALKCHIPDESKFDRKHYFYPDLPKGYQITQYDVPIAKDGMLLINGDDEKTREIHIERAHLEEDAAKNTHTSDRKTLVDFNRAGAPLIEIVTRPDFRSPQEAKRFLQELQRIMRAVSASNADMEKGQMRCDANISLRASGTDTLHPKTEVKNINSFRAVERALIFEIKRQTDLWHTHTPPAHSTTRGWDDNKQETFMQRGKEAAHDYRYFPEPDIPPIKINDIATHTHVPELPEAKRARLHKEYGFKKSDIEIFLDNPALGAFAENTMSECEEWMHTIDPQENTEITQFGSRVGSFITSKLLGELNTHNLTILTTPLTPENLAELMSLFFSQRINSTIAQQMLGIMVKTDQDPSQILEEKGMHMDTEKNIDQILSQVVSENPDVVAKYKAGKVKLIEFLVGCAMKKLKGSGNPEELRKKIKDSIV